MDALVPAAGSASRMRGIPKFLLPCDTNYLTLIERHVSNLLEFCETVWIPTRPELVGLLDSLGLSRERTVILPMRTETMTETILRVLTISGAKEFQLVMPDTFFQGELPYRKLSELNSLAELALWNIRDEQKGKLGQVLVDESFNVMDIKDKDPFCSFDLSWGALSFKRDLVGFMNPVDPHIGFSVKTALESGEKIDSFLVKGRYFDCGTPTEYLSMISEVVGNDK